MSHEISLCNCSSLRKASRRLSLVYDAFLAPCAMKATQYSILIEINRRQGTEPTLRELAESLAMDASTLGQNLRPLERDKLISIEPGRLDRRRRNVRLTRRGSRIIERAEPLWQQAQAWFEQHYGVDQAATLRALLGKVVDDTLLSESTA